MSTKFWLCLVLILRVEATCVAQRHLSLQESIELALQYNYDILLTKNYSAATAADNRYSAGLFTPDINGTASQLWIQNDQKQTLADNSERNKKGIKSQNLNASLQLNWVLFDGTKMFATRRKMEEIALQGNLGLKEQTTNTVALVINSYFRIVREKQQLKAIEEQISISETRTRLAEKKLEVGAGSKPELLQAKVDLNGQRSNKIEQEALIVQLKEAFNAITGNQIKENFEVSDSIPINLFLVKDEILSNIEETNPGLAAAKKDVKIADLILGERKAERFPLVSFNSAYNFTRNNNKEVVNPFSPLFTQNQGYNYGFSVILPLFRGFEIQRSILQSRYNLQYQRLYYEREKVNVNVDVNNGFTSYEKAKKILAIEEENIGLAKENVEIAMERFKRGMNTFIEVRTAQFSLADAYNRLILARFNAKVAETELLRLKGELVR